MCRFINNMFPANDILLITIYTAIKKWMHAECICNKLFQYLVTRSDQLGYLSFVPRREPGGLELWKAGVFYPGPRTPLICLSETISSYDRWYRSDTHVLRHTEGSSRFSDELPCRAIFTNLTSPRRRRRGRRKERSGRCEDDSLPCFKQVLALRVYEFMLRRDFQRDVDPPFWSRKSGDSGKKSRWKRSPGSNLPKYFAREKFQDPTKYTWLCEWHFRLLIIFHLKNFSSKYIHISIFAVQLI